MLGGFQNKTVTYQRINGHSLGQTACADLESFVRGGPNFDNGFFQLLFLFDDEREDLKTTVSGPSSARQRNAI